jgi:two-component system chemotaxis response regulator CheY
MSDHASGGGGSTVIPEDLSRLKFLIVDDSAFVRNIVQTMLLKSRAKFITHAASGKEAMEALGKTRCDCIISDWNMAPIGGLELLQKVRAGKALRTPADICFILLTGHSDANVVNVAINLDVNAYLVKPVSYEKLIQSIFTARQRKWRVKGPKYYEAVQGVEIAPPMKAAPPGRTAPWVTWIMKSPKRGQLEERLQQMRTEIELLRKDDGNKEREIRNKRLCLLDEVPPGSVLAEDIYGEHGKLLIGAGILLNQNVLGRLQELTKDSGQDVKLWIGDA